MSLDKFEQFTKRRIESLDASNTCRRTVP